MKKFIVYASLILAASFAARAEVVKIELPLETVVYKPGAGSDAANANCLTCHSVDYTTMQPPMPAAFWRATVDKMIGKYGAPIDTNKVDELVGYLTKAYGVDTNPASSVVVTQ